LLKKSQDLLELFDLGDRSEYYSYKSSRAGYYGFGGLGFDFKYKYWQWILVGIIGVILYYIFSKWRRK